ncbi:MAG: hypothetical protein Q9224_005593 [Gallowayella concinna]
MILQYKAINGDLVDGIRCLNFSTTLMAVWIVISMFSPCLYCLPESRNPNSSLSARPASKLDSISMTRLNDEFTGLSLIYNHRRTQPNSFSIEALAIAAIHALKESALEEYDATLLDYDFIDALPPADPVLFSIHHIPRAHPELVRRNVMWAIKNLAIGLMHSELLYGLEFNVKYRRQQLYWGVLVKPIGMATTAKRSISPHAFSLSALPSQNFTNMVLSNASSLQHDTHYAVNFDFMGQYVSKFGIFESILTFLLELAREDAATPISQATTGTNTREAQIFLKEVSPPPSTYRLRQYHVVALLEAVARYYVLHDRWSEMTFELVMDGYLVGWGCVTRKSMPKPWCRGMFPDGRGG